MTLAAKSLNFSNMSKAHHFFIMLRTSLGLISNLLLLLRYHIIIIQSLWCRGHPFTWLRLFFFVYKNCLLLLLEFANNMRYIFCCARTQALSLTLYRYSNSEGFFLLSLLTGIVLLRHWINLHISELQKSFFVDSCKFLDFAGHIFHF